MILHRKAKIDFKKWVNENYFQRAVFNQFQIEKVNIVRNALIIEWLDSVRIRISIIARIDDFGWIVFDRGEEFYQYKISSRQEATEKAIEKAIEIYNDKK